MQSTSNTFCLAALRNDGCVKIKVTDPKKIPQERNRIATAALRLGRAVTSSYKYPWLYVLLGDKLGMAAKGESRSDKWSAKQTQSRAQRDHFAGFSRKTTEF